MNSIRLQRVSAAVMFLVGAAVLGQGTAQAADAWSRLKAGDWVVYKSAPAPGMEARQKWVVKEVTAEKVVYTIETTTLMNGKELGPAASMEQTYDLKATAGMSADTAVGQGAKTAETEETVTVNGKELKVKVYTAEGEAAGQKFSSKTWISEEVPFGTVKSEANGVVALELVEWGSGS